MLVRSSLAPLLLVIDKFGLLYVNINQTGKKRVPAIFLQLVYGFDMLLFITNYCSPPTKIIIHAPATSAYIYYIHIYASKKTYHTQFIQITLAYI
jgi:hypothetical protein